MDLYSCCIMPKCMKPRPGQEAMDSQDDDALQISSAAIETLMKAMKESELRVLAKTDSLNKKIEDLSRELHQQIANTHTEYTKVIKEVEKVNAAHATRIISLEGGANAYLDTNVELESTVKLLTSQVKQLVAKTEDLESRQRRDNCRIIGVEEGFGETRLELAALEMLQDTLALDYSLKLDQAHRSLQPKQLDNMNNNHLRSLNPVISWIGQFFHSGFDYKARGTAILIRRGLWTLLSCHKFKTFLEKKMIFFLKLILHQECHFV